MSWTAHYSALDRAVHRAAFASTGLQKIVADMEDTLFQGAFGSISCERPVFITSLPRAGTTLLLDLVSELPVFATHTYRNMPFLLCPLIWDRVTRGFRQDGAMQERAHGDGMLINYDSPEAFEEALWRAWWPDKYHGDGIDLWQASDDDEEFRTFFVNHLKKVIALGRKGKGEAVGRYIAKNNANIARLPLLAELFPGGTILIPVRDPVSHVQSLHRQHLRFLKAHEEDAFAKTYMRGIGHLDFGANFAPLKFEGFSPAQKSAETLSFWLEYWIAAYAALLKAPERQVTFVSYQGLCRDPRQTLEAILTSIGEPVSEQVEMLAARVKAPARPVAKSLDGVAAESLAKAQDIYDSLIARSVNTVST